MKECLENNTNIMFTARTGITKIGSISITGNGCFSIEGAWHFFGSDLVDANNVPITDKWKLRSIKVGRLLRKVFGYKILAFLGAYKGRHITIAGWTPEELAALSSKQENTAL